jgi:hypothetical protein
LKVWVWINTLEALATVFALRRNGILVTLMHATFMTIWISGALFLAGLLLNDIRLIYNNIVPGEVLKNGPPSRAATSAVWLFLPPIPESIGLGLVWTAIVRIFGIQPHSGNPIAGIDPTILNDAGRTHRERAIRHQWIMIVWTAAGLALMALGF